jgi:hypothetical protein
MLLADHVNGLLPEAAWSGVNVLQFVRQWRVYAYFVWVNILLRKITAKFPKFLLLLRNPLVIRV